MLKWIRLGCGVHDDKKIYRQSLVKNQPINHKVDNFHVLTKVPTTREKLKQEQKFPIHPQRE